MRGLRCEPLFKARPTKGVETVEEGEGLIEHFGANGTCQFFFKVKQASLLGSCHLLQIIRLGPLSSLQAGLHLVLGGECSRNYIFSMDPSAKVANPNVSNEGEDMGQCI